MNLFPPYYRRQARVLPKARAGRSAILLSVLLLANCSSKRANPGPETPAPQVDGQRALNHVTRLVECGPRVSGSAGARCAQELIEGHLRSIKAEVQVWRWEQATPRGTVEMVNLAGRLKGNQPGGPILLLGSHYDTKWMGANSTFVGANDGGSSTGLLMEIGSSLSRRYSIPWEVWLVFFDGEECVEEYGPTDGLYGSRHFANWLNDQPWLSRVEAAIVLDMVGDVDLTITLPRDTPSWIAQGLFAAADRLGHRPQFGYARASILDDHVPLANIGLEAADVIDFAFGDSPGANNYWHTEEDTLERVSADSLEVVGNVVLDFFWKIRKK